MVKLMGCLFGKPTAIDDRGGGPKERQLSKGTTTIHVNRVNSSRWRRDSFRVKVKNDEVNKRVDLIDKKLSGSNKVRDINSKDKRDNLDQVVQNHPAVRVFPKAVEGEQVAAGWPPWLASAAAEAIGGWVPRRADTFEKLDKIGQGTYSIVYKARDLTQKKIVALKRVRFDCTDPESVKFMAREIIILRRLNHPNVIKLEGLVTSRSSTSLYLVLEYMEHDLIGLTSLLDAKFSEPQVKCFMQQLLSGLHHCHSRGILHRDIKGSNLLIDNNGILKIADFGLAALFDQNHGQPLTSRVVTLWYRPPELLLGATYYRDSVDLWSAGCILGELYAHKPIMPGRTEVEQLHKIFKLCGSPSEVYWTKSNLPHSTGFKPLQPYRRRLSNTFKSFPSVALGLLETLLSIDPADRGTAASALKSEFFTMEPLPCDPSCLPKYTPSKEMDAKLREEESRRQGLGGGRGPRIDHQVRGPLPPRALPAPDAHAGSMQKRQSYPDSESCNELPINPNQNEAITGIFIEPPRLSQHKKDSNKDFQDHDPRRLSHSGPLIPCIQWPGSGKKCDDIPIAPTRANLSMFSGSVASRTLMPEETRDRRAPSNLFGAPLPARINDGRYPGKNVGGSHQTEKGRTGSKEPILDHGSKNNKIRFSGPLLVPNKNMDQILKEHDRRVQEAARRSRIERARLVNNKR